MADQRQNDEPGDLPPSVLSLAATEQQLDAALAGAAGKIDALQQSVGTSGSGQAGSNLLEEPEHESLPSAIDSQLDEIDRLLIEAGEQLGGHDSETIAPTDEPKSTAQREAPVPDFLRDLLSTSDNSAGASTTELDAPAESPTIVPPKQAPKPVPPDFMAEFMEDSSAPADTAQSVPRSSSVMVKEPPTPVASRPPQEGTSTMSPLRRVIDGPIYSAADFGVSMLETVDRPFRRFSSRTKEVLGWLALIVLAATALVLILSVF